MEILSQFLLRLTFGLAFGMAITSPKKVASGFFRNHLYVTLGLATLAALACYATAPTAFWCALGAAMVSYIGAVCWLYENKRAGVIALLVLAMLSLGGTWALPDPLMTSDQLAARPWLWSGLLEAISNITSGLLLGTTLTAMFLGHWYLNSPTMELAPLRRLLRAMAAALILQAIVSAVGLACELVYGGQVTGQWLMFVLLRWSFGLFGVAVMCWMAWQMLKIPNTQSATGVLYVAVIGVFVGELTAALLSSESMFPL